MALKNPPLDESHFQILKGGIDAAEQAKEHIDMARSAGINVDDHEKRVNAELTQLRKLKDVYFPGRV